MKHVRTILALLIALSLVSAPVGAAMAAPHAATVGAPEAAEMAISHAGDMAGMDDCEKMGQQLGKHDCPCCDTGKACPTELCLSNCFKLICTFEPPKAARVMASMSLRPVNSDRPPDWSYAPQPPPPPT